MATTKLIIKNEVEIKFEGLSPECRRDMSKSLEFYVPGSQFQPSVRLGRWNGKMSYCDIGARSYLNLLDTLLPIVQKYGYDIEIEDLRKQYTFEFEKVDENSYANISWPAGHTRAGQPILLREHQVEIINSYLENLAGIAIAPTASGKTIMCAILSHKVQKYGRSIVIVPTKDLVTQTEEDYINLGLDVGVFFGDRKEYLKTHTICTWQSLESLYKKSKKEDLDIDIDKFFENVCCVIVDEVHRASGTVLRKLLAGPLAHAPIRWGLTGTMPEDEINKVAVISCIGPLFGKIDTLSLQEKGILAKLNINVLQLQDSLAPMSKDYQTELKWLTTNKKRIEFISEQIIQIAETGSTLILVDRIETGKMLQALIPDSVFVSGQMKSTDRKAEYNEVQEIDGKVIIATFSVCSTGVNIVRIFNLVLIEAGQSFVRVIQSIGRSLRVAPDKEHAEVFDICSSTKYSKKHLTKRRKIYAEAKYPFTVNKVTY